MKKFFKIVLSIVAVLVVVIPIRFAMLGNASEAGDAPGLHSGVLTPCPDKPNCVCSEAGEDAEHRVSPLDVSGVSAEKAWGRVAQAVEELGGEVVVSEDDYIAATFSSSLFGFVDDVEFRLDAPQKKIHIRSASRVGHSDMGVNRKRVEALTRSFAQ
jgi:uncharacterized protein (DUF1499 family)